MRRTRFSLRAVISWLVFALLAPSVTGFGQPAIAAATAPAAFVNPQFEQVWSRSDSPVASGAASRSWLWGPAPGEIKTEPFTGSPGGTRTVQYFDKARMEVNPSAGPNSQWATTTGLLVVEMVSGKVQVGPNSYEPRTPASIPVAGDASSTSTAPLYSSFRDVASLPGGPARKAAQATGSTVTATIDRSGKVGAVASSGVRYSAYSPETGHNIPEVFSRFMQSSGPVLEGGALQQRPLFDPVYLLGYPITEAYWTIAPVSGKPTQVLVQLYQRRVLTYVPGYTPAWQVQMGNAGRNYFDWRYGSAGGNTVVSDSVAPGPAAQQGPGAGDTFIHLSGNKLYYAGQPIVLKGTNYWMHEHPFVGTWSEWDGQVVKQELAKAKELGVNSIRIGISYDQYWGLDTIWGRGCDLPAAQCDQVNGPIVSEMRQFLQTAAGYNMKVLFSIFDWSDQFPSPGTAEYRKQQNYLRGIVTPFANDDRVLGWDLHNEPENYLTWGGSSGSGAGKVIAWLDNIAKEVRALDNQHPLTVGVANYQTLWLQANGRSILDIVDLVSFHCYDAGGLRTQIDAIEAHTSKPILLGEMGWPTGPAKLSSSKAVYDEPTQQFLYRVMLGDAKASTLVGVIQWTLQDNPLGTTDHYIKPTIESWFGLVRLDGSFKPAASDFRDSYPAPPLPSSTLSNEPLSKADTGK